MNTDKIAASFDNLNQTIASTKETEQTRRNIVGFALGFVVAAPVAFYAAHRILTSVNETPNE